jgi:UMF1 family MFS transporter
MAFSPRIFRLNKAIYGWAFYDWANSAFATTVMAGFFPVFFKNYWSFGTDPNVSTAQLALGNSLAGVIVSLLAPILGAIADRGGIRKKMLIFFAYFGAVMTACLFIVEKGDWQTAILVYVLSLVGFSGANIFYDSLLSDVSKGHSEDFVSGFGYGLGYLGGGLLFLVNVLMTLHPEWFGLADAATAVRYAFLSVAIWWGGFTLFTLFWVEEVPKYANKKNGLITEGFRQLFDTFKKVKYLKTTATFLLAYWLYIDGVHTIIRMAVDYGLSIGFKDSDLIQALLLVQFVAFPAAIIYAKWGEKIGVRKSLMIGIVAYIGITIAGMLMSQPLHFYLIAFAVGCFQGGIQALSRSYYNRLIPEKQAGEFFGFYNMIGKFAVILGPILIGGTGLLIKWMLVDENMLPEELVAAGHTASRFGLGAVIILFLGGLWLLSKVDEEKGKKEIAMYETH